MIFHIKFKIFISDRVFIFFQRFIIKIQSTTVKTKLKLLDCGGFENDVK